MKPSKTQVAILKRLAEGDKLILMRGVNAYFYWEDHSGPHPRYDSVFKLDRLGLARVMESWPSGVCVITDKGREYLAALKAKGIDVDT